MQTGSRRTQAVKHLVLPNGVTIRRVGSDNPKIVVLPGINDALPKMANQDRYAAWFCQQFARDYSVYFLGRKQNLPLGYTVRDMASDCAQAIESEIGKAHVLGISMGGLIAQELALAYSEIVDKLIIALAGCRMEPETEPTFRRWIELARERNWRELYLNLVEKTYGSSRRAVYQAMMPNMEAEFAQAPDKPNDFIVSVEACIAFNSIGRAENISQPTLIVGGMDDVVMPERGLQSLANAIPGSRIHMFDDSGHGAIEERKAEFDEIVLDFLRE